MANLITHILRALTGHSALPSICIPSAAVTDQDTEYWSDEIYMRGLLDATVAHCAETGDLPLRIPAGDSIELAAALYEVQDDTRWVIA